jgi:hypothetical protein
MTKSSIRRSTHHTGPHFYGRRINDTGDFAAAQLDVVRDVLSGKLSPAAANALNREARQINKMFEAALRAAELAGRTR